MNTRYRLTDREIVFVGGLHRSGTSLLHEILRGHEAISGFHDTGVEEDEGQLLQSVYPPASVYGGPGRFGLDAEAHLTERSPLASSSTAERLWEEWSAYWDLSRPILVEKSPPNLIRMRFLQRLFPRSSFIMVLRHPLVVSLATKKWAAKQSLPSLLEHWFACHRLFQEDRSYVERILVVRYEELCADPKAVMTRVAGFIDVRNAFDVSRVDGGANRRYLEDWHHCHPLTGRAYRQYLKARFGQKADVFGYRMNDPTWCAPSVT